MVGRSNEKKSRLCEACTEFVDDNLMLGGGSDLPKFFHVPVSIFFFWPFFVSGVFMSLHFLWWKPIFLNNFYPEHWGNGIQFDEHSFQHGWFNHEPGLIVQIWEGTCKK